MAARQFDENVRPPGACSATVPGQRLAGVNMAKKPDSTSSSATIHDQQLIRGAGGELHQIATGDEPVLTTAQG
ncbi:hypothetical protein, partial [Agrobacterium fabrum]|uniref:hypothetical protein n=1 Tax=Agrobacterium fabrum TaxID=1176649 RepID=UPI00314026DA